MSVFARLLYTWMIPHSDDFGRLPGSSLKIRALVVPMSSETKTDVEKALLEMVKQNLIIWYEVEGVKYIQINNFEKHQTGLHKRTKSKYPDPEQADKQSVPESFPEVPGSSEIYRHEENRTEENRREENRTEEKDVTKTKSVKENLCSIEDVDSFVEKHELSNLLHVDKEILVKFIDCLRLYRKTARISAKIIQTEVEKWRKYPSSVIAYAMWIHTDKHEDKGEKYTLAIMRGTNEHKANQELIRLKNKANQGENNHATNNNVYGGYSSEVGKNESSSEGTGYYDQFDGLFAN